MTRKLVLQDFDTTQRAERGGSPLINETASDLGIGHGTGVVLLPKRKLLALLQKAEQTTNDEEFRNALAEYRIASDKHLVPIEADEIYGEPNNE